MCTRWTPVQILQSILYILNRAFKIFQSFMVSLHDYFYSRPLLRRRAAKYLHFWQFLCFLNIFFNLNISQCTKRMYGSMNFHKASTSIELPQRSRNKTLSASRKICITLCPFLDTIPPLTRTSERSPGKLGGKHPDTKQTTTSTRSNNNGKGDRSACIKSVF